VTRNPLANTAYEERRKPRSGDPRGPYFRDQTAIIHSYAFRRLKHKAQVIFATRNDHVCTRVEHVLHVATIAATICKGLNETGRWDLNPDIAYAIGLGHDLGHAPFGHAGEEVIAKYCPGFIHEEHGYRVVERLGQKGGGSLNLTYAVRDGIRCHNGERYERSLKPSATLNNLDTLQGRSAVPATYEGCIVRFSDKIAYLGRDVEDAITLKLISASDVPIPVAAVLGNSNSQIIDVLVRDVVEASQDTDAVQLSEEKFAAVKNLYDFNIKNIYNHERLARSKEYVKYVVGSLFDYFLSLFRTHGFNFEDYASRSLAINNAFGHSLETLAAFYKEEGATGERIVADYVAGMTDSYALDQAKQIMLV